MNIQIYPKTCTICKQDFPADAAFFHKNITSHDGLSRDCKMCEAVLCRVCAEIHQRSDQLTVEGYLYGIYYGIKQRCENPDDASYHRYGKKGVRCLFASANEFADYIIGELESDPRGLAIELINSDGHYESGNIKVIVR